MICPYCGKSIIEDAKFCSHCGKQVVKDSKKNLWWWMPIGIALIIVLSLGSFFFYQQHLTAQAKERFETGEELAMEGNYKKAKAAFNKALDYRLEFPAAVNNKKMMTLAIKIKDSVQEAEGLINKKNYANALKVLETTVARLENAEGPMANQLSETINELKHKSIVAQISGKIKQSGTISELKLLYTRAANIDTKHAQTLSQQIKDKIINLTKQKATEFLKQKRYDSALAIVDQALNVFPDDDILGSLEKTVSGEQDAYMEAQQQRMNEALDVAAQEREHNQNKAVQLVDATCVTNEYGDITVKGSVKSTATVPVTSVFIYYKILDEEGNVYDKGSTYATPHSLYPHETGKFKNVHYKGSVEKPKKVPKYTVKIEKITWYIE